MMIESERHEIFVRAHTVVARKGNRQRPLPAKWPNRVLVFDTETTTDAAQKLTFGCYRLCQLGPAGYRCADEGLLYSDDLNTQHRKIIDRYIHDSRNIPVVEVKMFPPRMQLNLLSRSAFVERVFWKEIRKGTMVVGFNLPFDISRLAVKACEADKGGWSLVLSLRKSRKTGEMEPNPERPRVVINSQNSKIAFIGLSSIRHREEWPNEGRFLDLRTLGWALRDKAFNLERRANNSVSQEK